MKKKKTVTTGLAVALAAALVIGGGTMAYLSDSTEAVANTFNTNEVDVDLNESTGSDYEIIPGTSQEKDPTVTVNATVDSYVYVEVTDATGGLVEYEIAEGWTLLYTTENEDGSITSVYYTEVEGSDEAQTISVLKDNTVSYSADLTNEDMEGIDSVSLTFAASAIQKDGFNSAKSAYVELTGCEVTVGDSGLYSTLTEALADYDNATFTLVSDIETSEKVIISTDQTITLDLNGYTYAGKFSKTATLITVNGSLKITGEGEVSTNLQYAIDVNNGATLDVESGTITGNTYAVNTAGTVVINGGSFSGNYGIYCNTNTGDITINSGKITGRSGSGVYVSYGTLNISSGEITGTQYGVGMYGGTLTITNGTITGNTGVSVRGGATAEIDGGTITGTTLYGLNASNSTVTINGGSISGKIQDLKGSTITDNR